MNRRDQTRIKFDTIKVYLLAIVIFSLPACNAFAASVAYKRGRILIAGFIEGSVSILETNHYQRINTGGPKYKMAHIFAEHGSKYYFINPLFINVVDKATLQPSHDFDYSGYLKPGMSEARITLDGRKMYVGVIGWGRESSSGIYVIDLINKKQVAVLKENEIDTGFLDMSSDGKYLYIAGHSSINVISTSNDQFIKEINLEGRIWDVVTTDKYFVIVAAHPYPTENLSDDLKNSTYIYSINVMTGNVRKTVFKSKIRKMVFRQDGYIYLLAHKYIYKIDYKKLEVVSETNLGVEGYNLALSKNKNIAYIVASRENQLVVYDLEKQKVVQMIKVGKKPYGLLVD